MSVEGPQDTYPERRHARRSKLPGCFRKMPTWTFFDKDVYIATVSEGGSLHVEMRVKVSRGYVSAEKNFDEDLPIGYIPVDSVHSPLRKVNYTVASGGPRFIASEIGDVQGTSFQDAYGFSGSTVALSVNRHI